MKLERLSKFYLAAKKIWGNDCDTDKGFEAGFIYGLAEKVYVGACPAAMTVSFEPDSLRCVVYSICKICNLLPYEKPIFNFSDRSKDFTEFWIFKYEMHRHLLDNNQNNNVIRAMLCGYNPEAIEPDFDLNRNKL